MSTAAAQMSFFTIDTLQFSKRMQKAGMPKEVSEELAEVIKETHTQTAEGFATKQDIQILERGLRQDLQILEKGFRQDLELLKKDIIINLGSLLAIGIGIIAALIKL